MNNNHNHIPTGNSAYLRGKQDGKPDGEKEAYADIISRINKLKLYFKQVGLIPNDGENPTDAMASGALLVLGVVESVLNTPDQDPVDICRDYVVENFCYEDNSFDSRANDNDVDDRFDSVGNVINDDDVTDNFDDGDDLDSDADGDGDFDDEAASHESAFSPELKARVAAYEQQYDQE